MCKHLVYLILLFVLPQLGKAQFYNEGAAISIQSASDLYIQSSLINDVNGANQGIIYNSGKIHLTGDLTNNVANGEFDLSLPGIVLFEGASLQNINGLQPINFNSFTVGNGTGNIVLNKNLIVNQNLTFTADRLIVSTPSALLVFKDNATVTGSGANRFVSGPIAKIGDDAFTFPVGKGTSYHPLSISAPASSTDEFVAEYFNSVQSLGSTLDSTLSKLSTCEYWQFERTAGASNVNVTLGWNAPVCAIPGIISQLRVSGWDGAKWTSFGSGSTSGTSSLGSITSSSPISLSSIPLTIGSLCDAAAPTITAGGTTTFCDGDSVLLTSSIADTYLWSNGKVSRTIKVQYSGNYSVSVVGSAGCTPASSPIVVAVNPTPVTVAGSYIASCESSTTQLNASGDGTFSWLPTSGLNNSLIFNPIASPSSTTTYTVTATNSFGCKSSDRLTVFVDTIPPVRKEWTARYPDNDSISVEGYDIDDDSCVFVAGSVLTAGGGRMITVLRYNSKGQKIWAKTYTGASSSIPYKIVAGANCEAYVTGGALVSTSPALVTNCITMKYDSLGNQLWAKNFSAVSTYVNIGEQMEVDTSGNIYVGGLSFSSFALPSTDINVFAVKYDKNGNLLWNKNYSKTTAFQGSVDQLRGMKLGADQNSLFVSVQSVSFTTSGHPGYFPPQTTMIKYNSSGDTLWTRSVLNATDLVLGVSPFDYISRPTSHDRIDIDPSGNVYSTFFETTNGAGVVKYNTSGTQLFLTTLDTISFNPAKIKVDNNGNIFVAGSLAASQNPPLGTSIPNNYYAVKLSNAGVYQWSKKLSTKTNSFSTTDGDNLADIALDKNGDLYLTGSDIVYTNSGHTIQSSDMLTVKYGTDGSEKWRQVYDGPASSYDGAYGIKVDNDNNVYVVGLSQRVSSKFDLTVIKYHQCLENFVLNTTGLNSLFLPDTLYYNINGAGVSAKIKAGANYGFNVVPPTSGTTTVSLQFVSSQNGSDTAFMFFDLDHNRNASGFRLSSTSTGSQIPLGSGLVLFDPSKTVEFIPPFGPILIGLLYPNIFGSYADLKRKLDAGLIVVRGNLLAFKYVEEYNDSDGSLDYGIYDLGNNSLVLNSSSNQLGDVYGENRYVINLTLFPGFVHGHYYELDVKNEKQEKWYIKFKYN